MSVFLDQGTGLSANAFSDCLTISRGDGNLGDLPVAGDTSVLELTYDGAAPSPPTAARLHACVHNNFGGTIVVQNIVITAMNGGIDPVSGIDVTGNGVTYVDPNSGSPVIRIVYDVNNCNGNGIFVFDVSNNEISMPRPPLLYHELSHAFRGATDSNLPNDEPPAETDENVMRAELGYCLRDINNHDGGCGHGDDCSGPPTPDGSGCFIVSATTGSSRSAEVESLRRLRDRVAAASGLGSQLIDTIYGEYYRFSPAIAAELEQATMARQAVLWVIVRPLLAWYTLAGTLAFDHADRDAVKRATRDLIGACPRFLGRASIARLLETIRNGEPVPATAPALLREFAPQVEAAARMPFASWAILDALVHAWRSSTHQDAVDAVAQWLGSAPIDKLPTPAHADLFDLEMRALARFFDFQPSARRVLGERLARVRPDAIKALTRHGFASKGDSR